MGLPLRITYKDKDYVYQVMNTSSITNATTELKILIDGKNVELIKDAKSIWVQKEGELDLEPELVQALGRSVSLRFRM
jgi:hypothetical protein